MRKINIIILLFLTYVMISCSNTNISITELNTTEETTTEDLAYLDFKNRIADFKSQIDSSRFIETDYSISIEFNSLNDGDIDIELDEEININLQIDLEEKYVFSELSFESQDISLFQAFKEINNEIYIYSVYDDVLLTSNLSEDIENQFSILNYLDDISTFFDNFIYENAIYQKNTENSYVVRLNLYYLYITNYNLFRSVIGDIDFFDEEILQRNYLTCFFNFNTETDLSISFLINRFNISETINATFQVNITQNISLLETATKKTFNPELYSVVGANNRFEPMYTFYEPVEETLFLNYGDNYYRYYLEEGYFLIDYENTNDYEILITLYDQQFNQITGDKVFKIDESNYYYINVNSSQYESIIISPITYKHESN